MITWGECDARTAQGFAISNGLGLWTAAWGGTNWSREDRVSYPFAVMDDFGHLVPVPMPSARWDRMQ